MRERDPRGNAGGAGGGGDLDQSVGGAFFGEWIGCQRLVECVGRFGCEVQVPQLRGQRLAQIVLCDGIAETGGLGQVDDDVTDGMLFGPVLGRVDQVFIGVRVKDFVQPVIMVGVFVGQVGDIADVIAGQVIAFGIEQAIGGGGEKVL